MAKMTLNGKAILDYESDGMDCDVYFSSAYYEDGSELTDDELCELDAAYPEVLDQEAFERAISSAESYYEGER